jgi:DNA repair exonuclease SbcCD ATPase subunit
MQITKLRLKNFGRHESLTADNIKAVTGLVGVNGSGKSTVLTALEFAITGSLPDKAESYVRQADGVSNAEVYIEFTKDGSEGTILRQVGKTAKRVLTWEGKTYTKAKEVDTLMAEILGADKAAISNAIFINQGSLADLLFGTPAERQELFTRLLGIGYIEQRVGYLDGKIKVLSGGLQDFTALKDELIASQLSADKNVTDLKSLLSRSRDWSDQLKHWDTFSQAVANTEEAGANLQVRKRELDAASAGYKAYMNSISEAAKEELGKVDITKVINRVDAISALKNTQSELKDVLQADDVTVARNLRVETLLLALKAAEEEHADSEHKLENMKVLCGASVEDIYAQILQIELEVQKYQKYQRESAVLTAAQEEYARRSKALEAVKANPVEEPSPEVLKTLDDNINTLHKDAQLKGMRLEVLETVSNSIGTVTDTCPVCSSKLTEAAGITPEVISKLKEEVKTLNVRYSLTAGEKSQLLHTYDAYADSLSRAQGEVSDASSRMLAAMDAAGEEVVEPDTQGLAALRQKKQDLYNAEQHFAMSEIRLNKAKEAADNVTIMPVLSPLDRTQRQGYIDTLANVIRDCVEVNDTLTSMEGSLYNQTTRLRSAEEALDTACDKLTLATTACGEDPFIVETVGRDTLPAGTSLEDKELRTSVKASLEAKQQEWSELNGRLSEATRVLSGAKSRLDDLNVRMDKDKQQREIIEKLQTVRKALTKDAVPAAYLRYKFEQLLELTQEQLNTLDANFTVDLDPDNPLTFVFMRLDEDDSGWLPQAKLSGGQRVRLTVAFLLAVQRLIIPDVGFLVLDEPSQHVDDAGVESLKDLLSTLGETLGSLEAQVWVCDHKPELTMAYGSTITLK